MRLLFQRSARVLGATCLVGAGYFLAHTTKIENVSAQPKAGVTPASATSTNAQKRHVAYVFGDVPITREDLGEYLINIHGRDVVRLFVNQRIIEMSAAKRNIVVTPEEVEAIIDQDCKKLGMTKGDFEKNVLKQRYNTNLRGWRENSIRPRLMMYKMCRDQVKVEEADLKKLFENQYGEKVQCRVVLWPKDQAQQALRRYDAIRKSDKEFDDAARSQPHSQLAAQGGRIDPIGRHSGSGTAKIEEIAFSLKDGQISELIDTGGGIIVIKRDSSTPARSDVTFEQVREALAKEVIERQMEAMVPTMFSKLAEEAKPLFVLSPADENQKDLVEQSKRLLNTDPEQIVPKSK